MRKKEREKGTRKQSSSQVEAGRQRQDGRVRVSGRGSVSQSVGGEAGEQSDADRVTARELIIIQTHRHHRHRHQCYLSNFGALVFFHYLLALFISFFPFSISLPYKVFLSVCCFVI